jgi:hypothetical protein
LWKAQGEFTSLAQWELEFLRFFLGNEILVTIKISYAGKALVMAIVRANHAYILGYPN